MRQIFTGHNLVRAQTLAVVEGLDPARKRILLQFLYESNLVIRDKQVVSLRGANLVNANLSEADLSYDNLSNANLRGANLTDAVLRGAYLGNAKVTSEQLAEAKSLQRATMPNGQKYEDWLKTKMAAGKRGRTVVLSNDSYRTSEKPD